MCRGLLASHAEAAGARVRKQLGCVWPSSCHASPPAPPLAVVINSTIPTEADGKFKRLLQAEAGGGGARGDRGHGEESSWGKWALLAASPHRRAAAP